MQTCEEDTLALAEWTTPRVSPPVERFDDEGRIVFEYSATVECSSLGEVLERSLAV